MSRSAIVDRRYRLQAAELGGAAWQVVIRNVSWQGLEELTPVLHFDVASLQHLALDAAQRRELIRTTRSSLCSDWIGQRVELRAAPGVDQPTIMIAPPSDERYRPPPLLSQRRIDWYAFLWLALFLLAMLVLLWLNNNQ